MVVWVIIGIIALASIILGVSLHQAFWTLAGTIAAIIVICWVLTGLWDWLGEIGEKNMHKKKVVKKNTLPKVVAGTLAIIAILIAIAYFFWS